MGHLRICRTGTNMPSKGCVTWRESACGIENSLFMPNGTIAENNTERVTAARLLFEQKLNNCK